MSLQKIVLVALSLALGVAGGLSAKSTGISSSDFEPNDDVYFNAIAFLYGTPSVGYEHALTRDNSFTGEIAFRNYGIPDLSISFLGLGGSYRWWLAEHSRLRGFFAGPKAYLMNVSVNYNIAHVGYSASSLFYGLGGEGGYQWVFPNHLLLNAGGEILFYGGGPSLSAGAPGYGFGGVGAGLKGSIGYAF